LQSSIVALLGIIRFILHAIYARRRLFFWILVKEDDTRQLQPTLQLPAGLRADDWSLPGETLAVTTDADEDRLAAGNDYTPGDALGASAGWHSMNIGFQLSYACS
jgi:hypothetical protein